jgi:tetratricopeptide (TPR) repeat protein
VTPAADADGRFLEDIPPEVRDLLEWYGAGQPRHPPSQQVLEFASKFLGALRDDGAVVPRTPAAFAPETLVLVLLHHRSSREDTGAWLNLGFALRRMALYRTQDPEPVNRRRLQRGLEAFERCLRLDPGNRGKNVRAWTGKAFTYHQLGLHDNELRCCSRALDADRSDPKLWLFYGFALRAAGRAQEALSVMDNAYHAYLMAGEPEELRDVFAGVQSALH